MALAVVAHESHHVLGYSNEAQVECYGMQSIWFVANKLGASVVTDKPQSAQGRKRTRASQSVDRDTAHLPQVESVALDPSPDSIRGSRGGDG